MRRARSSPYGNGERTEMLLLMLFFVFTTSPKVAVDAVVSVRSALLIANDAVAMAETDRNVGRTALCERGSPAPYERKR